MKTDLDTFMARDDFLTGYQRIDLIHEEFYELLTQLRQTSHYHAAAALMALMIHCKDHLGQEEQWMRETRYSIRDCHIKEHAEVLASFDDVHGLLCNGDHRALPHLIEALKSWFPGHVQHFDSSLAHWFAKRQ
jgi:hemerythrin